MPTKTIYVSDEDKKTFETAKELAGKNLSALIVSALRDYIERTKSQQSGLDEICFPTNNNGVESEKRFWGRIIFQWNGLDEKTRKLIKIRAYETRKKQLAVIVEQRLHYETDTDFNYSIWRPQSKLYIAKSAKELVGVLPKGVPKMISDALTSDTPLIEYMDI